jgi:hypothetical protein
MAAFRTVDGHYFRHRRRLPAGLERHFRKCPKTHSLEKLSGQTAGKMIWPGRASGADIGARKQGENCLGRVVLRRIWCDEVLHSFTFPRVRCASGCGLSGRPRYVRGEMGLKKLLHLVPDSRANTHHLRTADDHHQDVGRRSAGANDFQMRFQVRPQSATTRIARKRPPAKLMGETIPAFSRSRRSLRSRPAGRG